MRKSTVVLHTLGGGVVDHEGAAQVSYQIGEQHITAEVYVTSEKCVQILRLSASVALGLVQPGDEVYNAQGEKLASIHTLAGVYDTLKQEYSDVFTGLECFPGKYQIQIQLEASPVIDHPQRVRQALYAPLRDKLNNKSIKA